MRKLWDKSKLAIGVVATLLVIAAVAIYMSLGSSSQVTGSDLAEDLRRIDVTSAVSAEETVSKDGTCSPDNSPGSPPVATRRLLFPAGSEDTALNKLVGSSTSTGWKQVPSPQGDGTASRVAHFEKSAEEGTRYLQIEVKSIDTGEVEATLQIEGNAFGGCD